MIGGGTTKVLPKKSGRLWMAVAAYLGYVIGVGMFGLPYAIGQAGFFLGLAILFLLSAVMLSVHVLYADVIVATPGKHRLVGYVRTYLGEKWVRAAHWINVGGFWGVLLIYAVMGGHFLHTLLWPVLGGTLLVYQVAFLCGGFLWCLLGIRRIAILEAVLMLLFFLGIGMILMMGISKGSVAPFLLPGSVSPLVTYGVILFSLIADGVVPEMKEVLGTQKARLREALVWASMIVTVTYGIFSTVVFSMSGQNTSPDTFSGLGPILGAWIAPVGAVLGFIAVTTSFFLCALALYHGWRHDMHLQSGFAWVATLGVPLLVLLIGAGDAIELMAAIGAIFGGCTAIIILLIYHAAAQKKLLKNKQSLSPKWVWLLCAFLAAGVLLECKRLLFLYAA